MNTYAKMREALKAMRMFLDGYTVNNLELRRMVDAALTEPPRNCDVGTAEEQTERFESFCDKNGRIDGVPRCEVCPLLNALDCSLVWAQMPYEEGGAK